MKFSRDQSETIQTYLSQLARFPRPTAAEESAAAEALMRSRRRLSRCILQSDFVLRRVAKLLRRLRRRQGRLDHTIGFATTDTAERSRITKLLPIVLREVSAVERSNRQDFKFVVSRHSTREQRQAARRRMGERRRAAAAAVARLRLRTRQLQHWQRQFAEVAARVERLADERRRLRVRGAFDEARSVARELCPLKWLTLERPQALGRHLARCRRHESEYERAKQYLVSRNLRLVVAVAKRYRNRGVSFLDLIQEGSAGLLHAVDRWDPRKGKLGTYATWWVRQAVKEAVHTQGRMIRLPDRIVQHWRRMQGAVRTLVERHGVRPDVEMVAELAGLSPEQADHVLRIHREPLSLDRPLDADDGAAVGELLQDPRPHTALQTLSHGQLKQRLADVLTELNDRQRTVISLRYGLLDGQQRTLDEVGRLLSITKEGVRQIESRAVDRLRHPAHSRRLRGFLDWDEKHRINGG
ncbi:MAG TPA: RNA polymerase sigma factor RpoD/SigA [Pirellulales bacterium]|nr:RNA polymerase sigma factor RpoD/SigA [Pirellulales bacterium]